MSKKLRDDWDSERVREFESYQRLHRLGWTIIKSCPVYFFNKKI